ncbi:MAG TPA: hypothetical protein DER23_03105 [Clostridiales bacterium]|nr:hypothetical protein [Clostridiales bacterium]
MKERIFTAKSVDECLALAASSLGKEIASLEYEIVEQAKKGFWGMGASDAKIKVIYQPTPVEAAKEFLNTVFANMGLNEIEMEATESGRDIRLVLSGEGIGMIIGHHGEILDAMQYLTNLATGKVCDDNFHITLDAENYREKREKTLQNLARRTANRAKKIGRNINLEPMSAYERRIIHATIQDIEGVSTFSVGSDDSRRIVVSPDNQVKRQQKGDKKGNSNRSAVPAKKPEVEKPVFEKKFVIPERPAQVIVKAKSIDDILPDVEETSTFND